jgi:putative transposase
LRFQYAERSLQFYDLHAWVIMSNHVHLLVSPRVTPSRFLQSVKGYTAREANRILQRIGQTFWQSESYDRWIRSPEEFRRVQKYIEQNPVCAGLVVHEEQYRWSSAYTGTNAGVAG